MKRSEANFGEGASSGVHTPPRSRLCTYVQIRLRPSLKGDYPAVDLRNRRGYRSFRQAVILCAATIGFWAIFNESGWCIGTDTGIDAPPSETKSCFMGLSENIPKAEETIDPENSGAICDGVLLTFGEAKIRWGSQSKFAAIRFDYGACPQIGPNRITWVGRQNISSSVLGEDLDEMRGTFPVVLERQVHKSYPCWGRLHYPPWRLTARRLSFFVQQNFVQNDNGQRDRYSGLGGQFCCVGRVSGNDPKTDGRNHQCYGGKSCDRTPVLISEESTAFKHRFDAIFELGGIIVGFVSFVLGLACLVRR